MELGNIIDEWWATKGRGEAYSRLQAALADEKIRHLGDTIKDKSALRARLADRVDFDILDVLVTAL